MERSEALWIRAHDQAQGFMRRFGDDWTRSHCEDLVQEATIAAWKWASGPHDPARFWAAIRTIARRIRYRALTRVHRRNEGQAEGLDPCTSEPAADRVYLIQGRRVSAQWLRPCLQRVLGRLPAIDRQLLLGFHEGFCCKELGARFHRTSDCVKTRIHRARSRVQREIEASVRAADDLDES